LTYYIKEYDNKTIETVRNFGYLIMKSSTTILRKLPQDAKNSKSTSNSNLKSDLSTRPKSHQYVQYISEDGLEIVIDQKSKQAFASQSAAARMLNTAESTIRGHIALQGMKRVQAEIHTTTGLKTAQLVSAKDLVILAKKFNPDLLEMMSLAGATVYLYGLAGYSVQPEQNRAGSQHPSDRVKPNEQQIMLSAYEDAAKLLRLTQNTSDLEGLHHIIEEYQREDIDLSDNELYTIGQFVEVQGVQLSEHGFRRLALMAAATFKAVVQEIPEQVFQEIKTKTGKTHSKRMGHGYTKLHFPILQQCLNLIMQDGDDAMEMN
jgi:hypothetical protein